MAAKIGCPIIGLIDSGGARITEGIHALAGYGDIFYRNVRYSGIIPQISLILGPCAGGAVYSPALTDILFAVDGISQLFITGPQVIKQVLGQETNKEELGGTALHTSKSGVVHNSFQTEADCFAALHTLFSYLPDNYKTSPPFEAAPEIETSSRIASLVPSDSNKAYDMRDVIHALTDNGDWFELQPHFGASLLTGFARIGGHSVGIVANQPLINAGGLDCNASIKGASFINLCNMFDIPVVSLVDVPGFIPGVEQEQQGIIRHGAKLLHAYAHATCPKITVIIRKAFGGAYIVMGSKQLGADFVYAWPTGQIAVLGPSAAVSIINGKELQEIESQNAKSQRRTELEEEYAQKFLNPFEAAEHGYIDGIIQPSVTREKVISALEISREKVEHLMPLKALRTPL